VVRSDYTGDKEMEEALPLFCFFKEKKLVSSRVMKESRAMGRFRGVLLGVRNFRSGCHAAAY
jgi:hypothetical protein